MIAVVSFSSTNSIKTNLKKSVILMKEAAEKGAKAIFFPEATDYVATNSKESVALAQPLTSIESPTFLDIISKYSKELKLIVSLGVHEKSLESNRIFNTHVLIDNGDLTGIYRKLHLFDVDLPTVHLMESHHTIPGDKCLMLP
jgi:predicted amidohydrolase